MAKVLDAAEEVFAERGFAAARVDDIAGRAGLAKSHVYYHFAGKQQIFDALVATRIDELLQSKHNLLGGFGELGERPLERDDLTRWASVAITRLLSHRVRFLRIVLTESLTSQRSEDGAPSLLVRALQPVLDDVTARFSQLGWDGDRQLLQSDALNFAILPAVMHVVLRDEFAAALGVQPDRASELFVSRLATLEAAALDRHRACSRAKSDER